MLFNGGLVPTYLLYTHYLNMKNTLFALLIPGLLLNGFNVMIIRTYFATNIPDAVIESALVDGAGKIKTFFRIVLPLSYPIMATIGLFSGIAYWNDWYNGLIYLTEAKLFSIQNILNRILLEVQFLQNADIGGHSGGLAQKIPMTSVRMAIAAITIIPILIAYPFFQKYFVKGIMMGSVKG
jgi:putative aldouronate transport system permease protein